MTLPQGPCGGRRLAVSSLLSSLFSLVKCEPPCGRCGALPSGPFTLAVPRPGRWWALWVRRLRGFIRVPAEAQSSSGGGTQSVQPQAPGCRRLLSASRSLSPRAQICLLSLRSHPGRPPPPLPSPGTVPGKSLDCGAVALLLTCRRCSRAGRLLPRHRFRVSFTGSRWSWKKTSTVLLFPANGLPRLPVIFQA